MGEKLTTPRSGGALSHHLGLVVLIVAVALLAAACVMPPPDPSTPRRWEFSATPSFVDEFDVDGPVDPAVWVPLVEQCHDAALTDSTRNVRVEGGSLVIEAHAEPHEGKAFTSAMVQTRRSFLHGRFEARMKFPVGGGTWPAFWLCCTGPWPNSGEIDVVEHYAGSGLLAVRTGWAESTIHSSPNGFGTDRGRVRRVWVNPDVWHTYAVEWAPDEIRFYIDDVLTSIHRSDDLASADGGWPFATEPEYLLFDLFLGGPAGPVDAAAMPQRLLVDWVHGYDLVGPA